MASPFSLIGFGTWVDVEGGADQASMEGVVSDAIACGYRRFDTAHDYQTEEYVLKAVHKHSTRSEVHITSKSRTPPLVDKVREILASANNTHYDNFLLHIPPKTANREEIEKQLVSAWEKINEYQRKDLTKNIGVSNFYKMHFDLLLSLCEKHQLAPPTSNQLEITPLCQEREYVQYLQEKKIHVIAHTPIGGLASGMIFESEAIVELAKSLQASPAQAILATSMYRGIEVIPRATKLEHMKQNFHAVDFVSKITAEHLATLATADIYTNMVDLALEAKEFNDQL
jgi:diketogulonate reductase-like aldo/keto reductase